MKTGVHILMREVVRTQRRRWYTQNQEIGRPMTISWPATARDFGLLSRFDWYFWLIRQSRRSVFVYDHQLQHAACHHSSRRYIRLTDTKKPRKRTHLCWSDRACSPHTAFGCRTVGSRRATVCGRFWIRLRSSQRGQNFSYTCSFPLSTAENHPEALPEAHRSSAHTKLRFGMNIFPTRR